MSKKNVSKNKPTKKINSEITELIAFLLFSAFLVGVFSPLFYEFSRINLILKILMILGSVLSTALLIFYPFHIKLKENKKVLKFYISFIVIYLLSIISYFDFSVFGLRLTILGLLILLVLFKGIQITLKGFKNNDLLSEQFIVILISFMLLFFWMAGVYQTSNNKEYEELFLKISFGLLYLISITSLIKKYLYQKIKRGIGQTIIDIIIGCCLIIFSLPYYIKWCGVKGEDFNLFVNIYTAIIGGGLTLIGVAWTIKKNNDDRKLDQKASVKPLLYPISHMSDYNYKEAVELYFYKSANNEKELFLGIIKNTDNGILIVKEALINDERYVMDFPVVLDKNIPGHISVLGNQELDIQSMYIIGQDILGNIIKYKLVVNKEKNDIDAIYVEEK